MVGSHRTSQGPTTASHDNPLNLPGVGSAESPLRRLTNVEYDNTVRDLLGDSTRPAISFAADALVDGFDNNAATSGVSTLRVQQYMDAAEKLTEAFFTRQPTTSLCAEGESHDACSVRFIEEFGRKSFRRPLRPDEVGSYQALYSAEAADADFSSGLLLVVQTMLQSPEFLYRVESGRPVDGTSDVILTDYEVASRLSYLLWNSMPDEVLFDAAQAEALRTQDQVNAQIVRMLQDSKAHAMTENFFDQWLELHEIEDMSRDPERFPRWADGLPGAMTQEIRMFTQNVVWKKEGTWAALLSDTETFVNEPLASIYHVQNVAGSQMRRVQLAAGERGGVLRLAGFLAAKSLPDKTSAVKRGKFIRHRMFCTVTPEPPDNVQDLLNDVVDSDSTARERWTMYQKDPVCAACHTGMDPLGLTFERFDALGERLVDPSIDTSGEILQTADVNRVLADDNDMIEALKQSESVKRCFTTQWFRFATGRHETEADGIAIDQMLGAFLSANGRVLSLPEAFGQTERFRYLTRKGNP